MAKREIIKIDDHEDWGFNVSETVGIGGANKIGDVMLIQAMFRFLGLHDRMYVVGVKSVAELPEVNGKYTRKLGRLIHNYQRRYYYALLSADGLIHPASYQNRIVKYVDAKDSRLMTITLLHTELWMAVDTGDDYTKLMLRDYLALNVWI